MLNFTNQGEIDIRAATVLGVNVKESATPIGFFGTGLKYAIASVLRLGGSITILSGKTTYSFLTSREMVRGKEFEFIHMSENDEFPTPLGFTSDLGKAWAPWMLYRELFSNMKDEQGVLLQAQLPAAAGKTQILIECKELEEAHLTRDEFILAKPPLCDAGAVEFHKGDGKIFYHGILIGKLSKPAIFNYNLRVKVDLTEDRTFKYEWQVQGIIKELYNCHVTDPAILAAAITASKDFLEHSFDYDWVRASQSLKTTAAALFQTQRTHLVGSIYRVLSKEEKSFRAREAKLSHVQEAMVEKAKAFLQKHLGATIALPIIVDELGTNTLGLAQNGEIWLDPQCFELGTKQVAATLYEEYLHVTRGFMDESRQFQDFLLNKVISLCEDLAGEPL